MVLAAFLGSLIMTWLDQYANFDRSGMEGKRPLATLTNGYECDFGLFAFACLGSAKHLQQSNRRYDEENGQTANAHQRCGELKRQPGKKEANEQNGRNHHQLSNISSLQIL
jgi:hypothetical protein